MFHYSLIYLFLSTLSFCLISLSSVLLFLCLKKIVSFVSFCLLCLFRLFRLFRLLYLSVETDFQFGDGGAVGDDTYD